MKDIFNSSFSRPAQVGAFFSALLIASTAFAQVYDAAKDFSFTANPHGPWSYGHTLSADAPLIVTTTSVSLLDDQFRGWIPNPETSFYPFVLRTVGTESVTWGSTIYPAGSLALHPEHFGRYAAVQWTAPVAGTFDLQTRFFDIPTDIVATVDVSVRFKDTTLFSGALGPQQTNAQFNRTLTVSVGDQLNFLVGSQGEYFWDHTGFNATLRLADSSFTPVPEPATYGLIGAAVLGVVSLLRRRRMGSFAAQGL